MEKRVKIVAGLSLALLAVSVSVMPAGCGSGATSSTGSPSPGGAAKSVASIKAYLEQVKPILGQVAGTVAMMPDAVKGLSIKPVDTGTQSVAKLDDVATQLDAEAASLAALAPPSALQPVQDAAVSGIESAQSAIGKLSAALDKRAAGAATRPSKVKAEIDKLKQKLSQLSQSLIGAIGGAIASPGSTPSPSARRTAQGILLTGRTRRERRRGAGAAWTDDSASTRGTRGTPPCGATPVR